MRIADQQTSVARAAAFAALVQALCVAALPRDEPLSRNLYLAQRAAAARGLAPTDELLELIEPAARELGSWNLVAVLRGPPEAMRQLEVGERDGPKAVAADLLARSE